MPKHYAVGKNIQHYTAVFKNTKVVRVIFDQPYDKVPNVQLTLLDSGNVPVYRVKAQTDKCLIGFKQKWTGEVDVEVTER